MKLRITSPLAVIVDEDNVQIVAAEDASGGFGIQPHHADFLTSLAVGVVSWKNRAGARRYCAVHGGILTISGGREVDITTREAIPGDDLATLDQAILNRFGAAADIETERAGRIDTTRPQLQAIRELVRHLRPAAPACSRT